MAIALYALPTGAAVAATVSLTITVQRTTDTVPTRRTQSAAAWAANVGAGLLTAEQLAAVGYRLPTMEDALRAGYAALSAEVQDWEARGWACAHRYLREAPPADALPAAGWAWWHYAGNPPQLQGRITDAVALASAALADGAPDAFPYPCATPADAAAGVPATQHDHTVAQLRAVQAAGGRHLLDLGAARDAAVRALQVAGTEAAIAQALDTARAQWAGACALPTGTAVPDGV